MAINRLIYGAWGILLLSAVVIAGANLKPASIDAQTSELGESVQIPEPLPALADTVENVEFTQEQVPGRLPIVSDSDPLAEPKLKALRKLVAEQMPGASDQEIKIWSNEFQDLPEEAVKFLLQQKRESGFDRVPLLEPNDSLPVSMTPDPPSTEGTLRQAHSIVVGNLLNSATPGYRRKLVEFDSRSSVLATEGAGLDIAEVRYQMTAGPITETGNTFDLALRGPGFFALSDGNNERFTRVGRFKLNADRRLTSSAGWILQGVKAVPEGVTQVRVSDTGEVVAPVDQTVHNLGRIKVARFLDASRLGSTDGCMFEPTGTSGGPNYDQPCSVIQGSIEGSNADPETERRRLKQLDDWRTLLPR